MCHQGATARNDRIDLGTTIILGMTYMYFPTNRKLLQMTGRYRFGK